MSIFTQQLSSKDFAYQTNWLQQHRNKHLLNLLPSMSTGTQLLSIACSISSGLFQSSVGDSSSHLNGASATLPPAHWGDEPAELSTTHYSHRKILVWGCLHMQLKERDSGHPLPLPSSFQERILTRASTGFHSTVQQAWLTKHSWLFLPPCQPTAQLTR